MSLDRRCPQCAFVSRQLGQATPCLLHVSLAPHPDADLGRVEDARPHADAEPLSDYDEPYAFGQQHPTALALGAAVAVAIVMGIVPLPIGPAAEARAAAEKARPPVTVMYPTRDRVVNLTDKSSSRYLKAR